MSALSSLLRKPLRAFATMRDYAVEGRTAVAAVAADTQDGDIQAATQRAAFVTQITRLEGIERRDLQQELLLVQLRRNVRALDRAEDRRRPVSLETHGPQRLFAFARPQGFLGGPLALLGGVRPWMLWTGAVALLSGFGMIQTGRLAIEQAAHQETRAELDMAERQRDEAQAVAARMTEIAQDADAQSRQTAETIERERALRQRAEAEARRIRRARDQAVSGGPIDYGFGGVREPEAGPGGDRGAGGDSR